MIRESACWRTTRKDDSNPNTTCIDDKELRCIANLHWQQMSNFKTEGSTTENVINYKGWTTKLHSIITAFNLSSEETFQGALDNIDGRIQMNGTTVGLYNLRGADDTVQLADRNERIRLHLDQVIISLCDKYHLKLNIKRTKSKQL